MHEHNITKDSIIRSSYLITGFLHFLTSYTENSVGLKRLVFLHPDFLTSAYQARTYSVFILSNLNTHFVHILLVRSSLGSISRIINDVN